MFANRFIWAIVALLCVQITFSQSFTDIAAQQGLTFLAESDNFGNGLSFYDFDQDGWDDLSFTMSNDSLEFYRNNNGTLERMPSFVYGEGVVKHVLWVDYDNDGDMDLFLSSYQKPYKLYRNDGDFNFTDVSIEAGLAQVNEKHYGASFGDYDKDGFLDLYICTYEFEGDPSMYNRLNHLYHNNGDGTFTDVTLAAGVGDGITFSFQSVWVDYDKDGWQDLLVINDRLHANSLYRNNTDGTFTNVALAAGVAWPGQDPMSASVSDFDNDGDLDVFHSNTGIVNKHFRLWINNDDGTFTESATQFGLEIYSWTWGAVWVDYNNNTFQDLYVTSSLPNGALESNFFLVNQQGEFFTNGISNFTGNHFARSFAAARGDLNNDGFYEIAVQNQNPAPPFLWDNTGGDNNYIKISLRGTTSNRMAVGSWIRVYAGGNCYTQYTHCGENYVGQNSQHHIFGLADYSIVDSVQIEYLSGHIDSYYGLAVNQRYYFVEGDTYQAAISYQGNLFTCIGDSVILNAGNHSQIYWNNGLTTSEIGVTESGFYWFVAYNEYGVTAMSDTVFVEVLPLPILTTYTDNPECAGDETGTIYLINELGVETLWVAWSNGLVGDSITNLAAGNYFFEYIDINGCVQTGIAQLQEPDELLVQSFSFPDLGDNSGSIQLIINGGTPPYSIFLDGEVAQLLNLNLAFGNYELIIIDANYCSYSLVIVVDNLTHHENREPEERSVLYPNPAAAGGEVYIKFPIGSNLAEVRCYETSGKLMQSEFFSNIQSKYYTLDVSHFTVGTYIIELIYNDKVHFVRLLLY
jgi:hypothetical protein